MNIIIFSLGYTVMQVMHHVRGKGFEGLIMRRIHNLHNPHNPTRVKRDEPSGGE